MTETGFFSIDNRGIFYCLILTALESGSSLLIVSYNCPMFSICKACGSGINALVGGLVCVNIDGLIVGRTRNLSSFIHR